MQRSWKILYIILCAVLLALAAYQFYLQFVMFSPLVPDYRGYQGAVQALDHQQDPYVPENLNYYYGNVLPFVYPPQTLYFFWLLQFLFIFRDVWMYFAFLSSLLIVSSWIILTLDQKPRYLFLAVLLTSGFIGLWWNFTRGNKDIIFLFLFAVIFALLAAEKYWKSAVVMGLTIGFSLFATQFAALYLVIRRPPRDKLGYIALSFGVVAALFAIGYCINPAFFFSYLTLMRGSNNQLVQTGDWNAPIPYRLFYDLLASIWNDPVLPTVLFTCVYAAIILYVTWVFYQKKPEEPLKVYSLAMLSLFMLLPRMMSYNFIILVLPLYLLFKDGSYRVKSLVLTVVCLLPLIVWYLSVLEINRDTLPFLLGEYVQTYSLLIVFFIVILDNHLIPVPRITNQHPG